MKSVIAILLLITLTMVGAPPPNDSSIYIFPVKNSIKMGSLSGNVNLTLGVKNILEEALMDKEFNLSNNAESSDYTLQAELIYFDILKTNSNISVFHKDNSETLIRMKGTLYKGGKKVKTFPSLSRADTNAVVALISTIDFNANLDIFGFLMNSPHPPTFMKSMYPLEFKAKNLPPAPIATRFTLLTPVICTTPFM